MHSNSQQNIFTIKIYFILALLTIQVYKAQSQVEKKPEAGVPVTVTNWDGLSLMIIEPLYDIMKDTLVAQLGEREYEKFKKNSTALNWPPEISGSMWKKSDSLLIKEHQEKLAKLHVYKIASYQHIYQGTNWGWYAVLRVPFSENKNWNPQVKWDTVYFMIEEKYIKTEK